MAAAVPSAAATPRLSVSEPVSRSSTPRHRKLRLKAADRVPSPKVFDQAAKLPVLTPDGSSQLFETLYAGPGKHMVVFVRHFFCGMCQDFLLSLSESISPKSLAALPQPTTLSIVGCGEPELIEDYARRTNCSFPIYADPTRKLYDLFGMTSTFDQGPHRPLYMKTNTWGVFVKSLMQVLAAGTNALKGGSLSQAGGEVLYEDGEVVWCHRMKNTRDHTEIHQLKKLLDL